MRRPHDELDWPLWIPQGSASIVVAVGIIAAYQHREQVPLALGLALMLCAASPFLYAATGRLPNWLLALALTLGPVVVFAAHPVNNDMTGFLLVMAAAQTASIGTVRHGLVAMGAAAAVIVGVEVAGPYEGAFIWVFGIALGWSCGFLMQNSLRLLADLKQAQADLAERAALGERQRIARELHDVLAHTLSVIMLHITGARLALETDPAEASAALQQAEQLGRRSLADVRQVVGLLRPDSPGADGAAPQPDASAIDTLVAGYRAAGIDVDLSIDGDVARIPPQEGLLLYRIVQESLTNVAKHASERAASVRLAVGPPLELEVRSPAPAATPAGAAHTANGGAGLGLLGMRERAVAMGGELVVGATPGGGEWRVALRVPSVGAHA
ncbi:MAG TPA: histidine kinase [Acidimicrobiales bacterium]